jgi:hypothetical protein
MSEKKIPSYRVKISVNHLPCDAHLSEVTESDIATISSILHFPIDRDFQLLLIEPRTVIYNNYLKDAQVINFSNEMKDKAQQTASNFIQNDNTPLLRNHSHPLAKASLEKKIK